MKEAAKVAASHPEPLRERFDEAVELVTLSRMVEEYDRIRRHLGRRRAFWNFLLAEWRAQDLIG